MDSFTSLGLTTRVAKGSTPEEERIEVRYIEGGSFIAWFQKNTRRSDGELVTSITTQFVRRKELTSAQTLAIKAWLLEHVREHI